MSLSLYQSLDQDDHVDQKNFLLIPMELARIMSLLILGTHKAEEHQGENLEVSFRDKKKLMTSFNNLFFTL